MVYASFDLLLCIVMEVFWRKLARVLMHLAIGLYIREHASQRPSSLGIVELLGLPASVHSICRLQGNDIESKLPET